MTVLAVLAQVDPVAELPTPSIEWWALLPLIILAVGAVILLDDRVAGARPTVPGFYALYTVAVAGAAIVASLPVSARVQGWSEIWASTSRTGVVSVRSARSAAPSGSTASASS